jgi:hypothetical protein
MNIEKYEDLQKTIKSGDYVHALSRYADLIQETVNYVVDTDVIDEPSYMLESIGIQKDILNKAEAVFEVLRKEDFVAEDTAHKLQELCSALRRHETFVHSMQSRGIDADDRKNRS